MAVCKRIKKQNCAIIQARMTSKRLSEKCMKDLAGKPLIDHVIERAKAIKGISHVILAVPDSPESNPLIERAKALGIESFMGSEDNVLSRYYNAALKYGAEFIIRITADNPLTDPDYASMALEIATESEADLCSISNIPLGTGTEIIKFSALKEAFENAERPYHYEHVTPYIKEHPEIFSIERHSVEIQDFMEGLRLTVDTEEDYQMMNSIFSALYKDKIFPLKDVLNFLKENPSIAESNLNVQQRKMTHSENA